MGISKVVYGKDTLLDLTGDTVRAEGLEKGSTAHDAAGNRLTGTAEFKSGQKFLALYLPCSREFLTEAGTYEVPDGYFQGNESISSVELAEGFVRIGENAFRDCVNLAELTLPSTLTSLGNGAMQTGAKQVFLHADKPPAVGTGVFSAEDRIFVPKESLMLYKYKKQSRGGWLDTDINTDHVLALREAVTERFPEIFIPCLREFQTPEGEYKIPDKYFLMNDRIARAELAEGITEVGRFAFSDCTELAEVILPSTLKKLGDSAFSCLEEQNHFETMQVTMRSAVPPLSGVEPFDLNTKIRLFVPQGAEEAYRAANLFAVGEVLPIPKPEGVLSEAEKKKLVQEILAAVPKNSGTYEKIAFGTVTEPTQRAFSFSGLSDFSEIVFTAKLLRNKDKNASGPSVFINGKNVLKWDRGYFIVWNQETWATFLFRKCAGNRLFCHACGAELDTPNNQNPYYPVDPVMIPIPNDAEFMETLRIEICKANMYFIPGSTWELWGKR